MSLQSSFNQILSVGAILAQTNPKLADGVKTREAIKKTDKKIEASKKALETVGEYEETLYDEAFVQETDINKDNLDFIATEEAEWTDRIAELEKEKFNLAPDKAQYGKYADMKERATIFARRQAAMREAKQAVDDVRADKGDIPSPLALPDSYTQTQALNKTRGVK